MIRIVVEISTPDDASCNCPTCDWGRDEARFSAESYAQSVRDHVWTLDGVRNVAVHLESRTEIS